MQREAASEIGEEAEEATNSKEEERAGGPDWPDVARGSRQTKAATPSQMEVKQSSEARSSNQQSRRKMRPKWSEEEGDSGRGAQNEARDHYRYPRRRIKF